MDNQGSVNESRFGGLPVPLLLIGISVVGIILRYIHLNSGVYDAEQSLWLFYAVQDTHEMLRWISAEVTGVLDVVVLHLLARISSDPTFLKSYQIFLFPPTAWFVYRISIVVFKDARPGLLAASIMAISPLLINYTQVLRYHTLVTFEITAALAFFVDYISSGKRRSLLLFAIFCAAAELTHPYAYFVFPALFAGVVASIKAMWMHRRRIVVAFITVMAFSIPPTFLLFSQLTRRVGSSHSFDGFFDYVFSSALLNIPDAFVHFLVGGHLLLHADNMVSRAFFLSTLLLYAVCFLAMLSQMLRRVHSGSWAGFMYAFTATSLILPFFAIPFIGMHYIPKFLLPFVPFFFITLSHIILNIKLRIIRQAATALALLIPLVSLSFYYSSVDVSPSYEEAFHFLDENVQPDDVVVFFPGYYCSMTALYGEVPGTPLSMPVGRFQPVTDKSEFEITAESLESFQNELEGKSRIWVFYGDGTGEEDRIVYDPEKLAYPWFEKNYHAVSDYRFYLKTFSHGEQEPIGLVRLYVPRDVSD